MYYYKEIKEGEFPNALYTTIYPELDINSRLYKENDESPIIRQFDITTLIKVERNNCEWYIPFRSKYDELDQSKISNENIDENQLLYIHDTCKRFQEKYIIPEDIKNEREHELRTPIIMIYKIIKNGDIDKD